MKSAHALSLDSFGVPISPGGSPTARPLPSTPEASAVSWRMECVICGSDDISRDDVVDEAESLQLELLACNHCHYQKIIQRPPVRLLPVSRDTVRRSVA